MKQQMIDIGLDWPLHTDSPIKSVLRHTIGFDPSVPPHDASSYWSPEFHGLTSVASFNAAPRATQEQILRRCNRAVLEEAYFVERAGIVFANQMSLGATNLEERMLYATFAADEARHLALLQPFVDPEAAPSPFHHFLSELIQGADRATLILVVQVVLEGWGLSHYAKLAAACRVPALSSVFQQIIRDEARHHGTGVILAERDAVDESTITALETLLTMVRAGPTYVTDALRRELPPEDNDPATIFRALDASAHAAERLRLIRQLLEKVRADSLLAQLDQRNAFHPDLREACA